jgi:hypothetical protein
MKTLKMTLPCHLSICRFGCVFGVAICLAVHSFSQSLAPLKYNHPGLVVDLGVGLWAWPIPWDANGDGKPDLLVSCPDRPSNGVWYFENSGRRDDRGVAIFRPARRLSATKKYLMPSYLNDRLHVLSPGEEYLDFAKTGIGQSRKLPVAANFYKPEGHQPKGPKVRHNQWRYVDYDGDGLIDLVTGIEDWSHYGWDDAYDANGQWRNGPLKGFVFVHRNNGSNESPKYQQPFKIDSAGKPLETFGCPSPNFADWDGDGDLDLICGEFLDGMTYFENTGTRQKPAYAAGIRLRDADQKPIAMHVQMIVPVAFDWNGDGQIDLIVGDEDGRVAFVENSGRRHPDHSPIFKQPQYFRQEAEDLKSGALATPVGFDWDGDGDMDIIAGNTAGTIEFFENLSGPKVANPKWAASQPIRVDGGPFRIMAGPNGSIQGPAEAKWGYTCLSIADWDHDGLPDLLLNSILGDVVWLKNKGTRSHPEFAKPKPIEVLWVGEQPRLKWGWRTPQGNELLTQWRTTPIAYDFNANGLVDLAMLDHEGYLAFFERENTNGSLTLKSPKRLFCDLDGQPLRLNAKSGGASGRRKIGITDWDGDGQWDLLVNSSNADWYRGRGLKDGTWRFEKPVTLAKQNIEGHDVSPTVVDFDGDGIPDFLGGAEDGRFYILKNPRSKP